jgi:hypothetical protein
LLITLVVIGVIGGLVGVRDAVISELADLQHAITALNVMPSAEVDATALERETLPPVY